MKYKILNEDGKMSLLVTTFIIIVLVFILYNINLAKTSYLNRDLKNKLDEIIRAQIIKTIDYDMLKDYTFGNGTVYCKYDEETKSILKNFNDSTPEYIIFKNNLINNIKSRFVLSIDTNEIKVDNINMNAILSYKTITGTKNSEGIYKKVYIPYIEVPYVAEFITSVSPINAMRTEKYVLDDSNGANGKITITRIPESRGKARIVISGQVTIRYRIQANML